MKNGNFKLAVFDMAGTTVQDLNEVEKCFFDAIQETELHVSKAEINTMMGWSKYTVFETLWANKLGREHKDYRSMVDRSYTVFKDLLESHYLHNEVKPIEGIELVFEFCRANNIKIGLTTGFYREVTDIILRRLGWMKGLDEQYCSQNAESSVIDCSVSSSDVANGRPAPDMILAVMEKIGISISGQVISVGDTPSDLESAARANVGYAIGVGYGTHQSSQLQLFPHNAIVSSTKELLDVLKNIV